MWTAARIDVDTANRNNVLYRVIGRLKPRRERRPGAIQVDHIAADLRQHFDRQTSACFRASFRCSTIWSAMCGRRSCR
jgi:hypothetical protein